MAQPSAPATPAGPAVPSSPDAAKVAPASQRVAARKPFGGFTKKLDIATKIPGYVLYWINDDSGRIESCLAAGFEFVDRKEVHADLPQLDGLQQNRDIGSRVSRPTKSTKPDGSTMFMYLMKLPQEFHDQDEAAKQARQKQIDDAIMAHGGSEVPQDGTTYRPNAGPTVQSSLVKSQRPQSNPTGLVPG